MRYKLSEIAKICGGRLCGVDYEVCGVETDSRNCTFGGDVMFVAMQGVNHDSHNYLTEMYERGVRAFMCERECKCGDDAGCVVVENSIVALQQLAEAYRQSISGKVVGITGSNGKTIVKEWIAQCLPSDIKLFRSPRSYNSQLGVALSLLMAEGDEDLVLIEAGISQRGEMVRLERMIQPEIVVVTSIGDAHQEGFESLTQKVEEKLTLAPNAKTIIYHSAYTEVACAVENVNVTRIDAAREPKVEFTDTASCRNAQIIEALFSVLGYSKPDFGALQPVAMRLEVKEGINGSLLVNDAYNSDINSLAIALDYLHNVAAGRPKVLILSDILQSGMSDEELYGRVATLVVNSEVEHIIGIGDRISAAKSLFDEVKSNFYASTDEFLHRMNGRDFADVAILLKGNRASRFEKISHTLERKSHTTVLEVNLDAMIHNLNYFRSRLSSTTRLTAMVKAASYGAGDAEVAQMLQHEGVDYLAVAFADEGVLLREKGVTMPIVVLNADEDSFDQMVLNQLEPEIYSFRSLDAFVGAVRRYGERNFPIHIKLDTGMHRLGFVDEELDALLAKLEEYAVNVRVATVFAHLSCADDPKQDDFTRLQIERFDQMSGRIAAALPYRVIRHTANSAAIERFPEAQFDMCRLGLGLYGFGFEHNGSLIPVSTLKTRIVQIKHHKAGEGIGYGRAERLDRDSVVATIPVGYADGIDRHLGCGVWSVLVAGVKAPIVGRVCMDSCMIDITDVPNVVEGDEVTVFSSIAGNTAEDMAAMLGTIPYEVLTSISGRVKRIYVKE